MSSPTEWLVDRELLREFPQRYARAVDQRDHEALAALFDPAGTIDGTFGLEPVRDYLEGMRTRLGTTGTSMHLLGDPLIDLTPGGDRAHLDTYAVVYQFPDSGDPFTLGMRYLDDLVRLDAGWRIHHRKTERVWMR
jgi:SnoaL-like domain